jgi:hypothetical protein
MWATMENKRNIARQRKENSGVANRYVLLASFIPFAAVKIEEREREKKQNCLLNDYQYEKKKKKQEKLESERKFVCQYVPLSLLIDALTHCLTMTISDFLSILQLILQLRRDN